MQLLKNKKSFLRHLKSYCKANSAATGSTPITFENAKEYSEIPGPSGPLGLGTVPLYWSFVGVYRFDKLHETCHKKYVEYGEIVKEKMIPGVDVLWLFNPNDIEKVLNESSPGLYPQRKSHAALEKYRKDRLHIYKGGGLLPTNGPEWWRIRSEFQKGLSSPQNVRNFLPDTDDIAKEFYRDIDTDFAKPIPDFLEELARLNMEILCFVVFDVRMNSFSAEERQPGSITSRLLKSAETTNDCIHPLDSGLQLWRYFETPLYKKLRKAQEFMESLAIDLVSQKISYFRDDEIQLKRKGKQSLLEDYLRNPNIDLADITGMACDLLLAGVDTTSYTTSFVLFHLAKNKSVQEKLFEETCRILPNYSDEIDAAKLLNQATYARAVLKESLRINPISVGVGRNLNTDLVLSGFKVPKGTVTVTQNMVASRLAEHFKDPLKFVPERWIKENNRKTAINPFLVLPFGHGIRGCIARRLAEQSILVSIIRVIRLYEIEWHGSTDLDIKTDLINKPDQPVRLSFRRRTEK